MVASLNTRINPTSAVSRVQMVAGHLGTARSVSSSVPMDHHVRLSVAEQDPSVAVLSFSRPPANAVSYPLVKALFATLSSVLSPQPHPLTPKQATSMGIKNHLNSTDLQSVRTLVLTSHTPGFFSAGIDINVLVGPEPESGKGPVREEWLDFWDTARKCFALLYNSTRIRTVAAINGFAPGMGCILSLGCQDRIMATWENSKKQPTIGLNEVQIGLPVPLWLVDRFADVCGKLAADRHLPLGTLFTPDQALAIGLVDHVVTIPMASVAQTNTTRTPLLDSTIDYIQRDIYAKLPSIVSPVGEAAWQSHMYTLQRPRQIYMERFNAGREEDLETCYQVMSSGPVQKALLATLKHLKKSDVDN
ncbi:dodecenoyl-CoA isomerase [Dispira parvispora]|uniref:Dodecenoyl-CoA isomerase n=1 Tax=Dispira parvispora TaxID=1520584 RepID=A0A9W8AHN4_9FUNG|nr:dodecenoyl-CoA isomerase [Dispira parvispora]